MILWLLQLIVMSGDSRRHIHSLSGIDRTDIIIRPRFLIGLRLLQLAHMANAVNPSTHVLFGVRCQIISPRRSFHVEHVRVLFFLSIQSQPSVHLFALIQIDDSLQLPALAVRVILQHILARQLALLQREPTASPSLNECKTETQEEEQF